MAGVAVVVTICVVGAGVALGKSVGLNDGDAEAHVDAEGVVLTDCEALGHVEADAHDVAECVDVGVALEQSVGLSDGDGDAQGDAERVGASVALAHSDGSAQL